MNKKSKRRIRRLNNKKHKEHLKYLHDITGNSYPCPAYYYTGSWKSPRENRYCYYRRCYRGSRSKYLKNQSNRKIRRYKNEIKSGNNYRRIYDYWWGLN